MSDARPVSDSSAGNSGEYLCPNCGKQPDMTIQKNTVSSCPSCGFKFGEKYWADRRRNERIKKEISTVLEYQGQCLESQSKDVSKGGLCVKTSDEFPGATGDTLGLFVGNQRFLAKVMWVDKLLNISTVGLQWKSRFINRIKQIWFSAASVGALFYLIFIVCLLAFLLYFTFLK